MNAIESLVLPPHLVSELALHLRNSGSTSTLLQAAAEAIHAWIAAHTPPEPDSAPSDGEQVRGYQWKTLFLPHGTEVRMTTRDKTHHARVIGDDLMYGYRRVSPRGMTLAIAGDGRNAWRDLWIRMPGEKYFLPASRCRRESERVAAGLSANPAAELFADMKTKLIASRNPPAELPVEQESATPVTMSEVLKTMLALMERLSVRDRPNEERRFNRSRREEDVLADHCAFD